MHSHLLAEHSLAPLPSTTAMQLGRSYHALQTRKELEDLVLAVFPDLQVVSLSKKELHYLINQSVINSYFGESYLKSLMIEKYVGEDMVAALEVKALNSRLDFLKINGSTVSYEIKSEVDNILKLEKQSMDYLKLFEYNNVVIGSNHLSHVRKVLPSNYGIIIERNGFFVTKRKPKKNNKICPKSQIDLFNKMELETFCGLSDPKKILKELSPKQINEQFKLMLKKRYAKKWAFLTSRKKEIFPLDYQYFYHHNIEPELIYG